MVMTKAHPALDTIHDLDTIDDDLDPSARRTVRRPTPPVASAHPSRHPSGQVTGRSTGRSSTGPRLVRLRRAAGWAAAAGTLPYLTLKVLWLTGHLVGVRQPEIMDDLRGLNILTVAMDAVVIALALALGYSRGRRLPAWLVLLPTWVATGLLVPIALVVLPGTLFMVASSSDALAVDPMAEWVRPMVYGGFAWQAIFLAIAFVLYAADRWSGETGGPGSAPGARSRAVLPLLRTLVGGGAVMVVATIVPALVETAAVGSGGQVLSEVVKALLEIAGLVGIVALVRDTSRRRPAVVAGWVGSAVLFAWGMWGTAVTVTASPLGVGGHPLLGLSGLAGVLGGFALAVAGLLAAAGTGVARPPATVDL
jgi:hypothetical protein